MQALVSRCWRADWPHQHLHAGDVDWWTVSALGRSPGLDERIRLWFAGEPDATELVGFAWYGPPNDGDLIVAPEYRERALIGAMVDWVETQVARFGLIPTGTRGGLDAGAIAAAQQTFPEPPTDGEATPPPAARIWTVAEETDSVRALAELGLSEAPEPGYVHWCGRLDELELTAPELPDGYALGTIRTDADIADRVEAGRAAFIGSTQTVEKYRFCRSTPLYRPALDTILRAPDGSVAAFALGWLDPLTGGVELEPVGVRPDHQRKGLGRAVCRATLRTAGSLGGEKVVIAAETTNPGAMALYASLGLSITARVIPYRRSGVSA
jgi:ribosomal protein S18 acetylase RimI-like enzyme